MIERDKIGVSLVAVTTVPINPSLDLDLPRFNLNATFQLPSETGYSKVNMPIENDKQAIWKRNLLHSCLWCLKFGSGPAPIPIGSSIKGGNV